MKKIMTSDAWQVICPSNPANQRILYCRLSNFTTEAKFILIILWKRQSRSILCLCPKCTSAVYLIAQLQTALNKTNWASHWDKLWFKVSRCLLSTLLTKHHSLFAIGTRFWWVMRRRQGCEWTLTKEGHGQGFQQNNKPVHVLLLRSFK